MTAAELLAARPDLARLVEAAAAHPPLAKVAGMLAQEQARQACRRDGSRIPRGFQAITDALQAIQDTPRAAGDDGNQPVADPADSDLLGVGEVARLLGCTRQHAWRLVRRGPGKDGIKAVEVGSRWLVRRADLERWQQQRKEQDEYADRLR
jgi:excisionase family DNA binding protein